jgi:hypothetical protein
MVVLMTMPPGFRGQVDINEEIDVVRVDPLFVERQRDRYASRGVAYIVLLNGLAAIALLIGLVHGTLSSESAKSFADAMMVFGIGALAGLASALFAYLRRTVSIDLPGQVTERRVFGWLAVATAIIGAGCFVGALNMARMAVESEKVEKTPSAAPALPTPSPARPSAETPNVTPAAPTASSETPSAPPPVPEGPSPETPIAAPSAPETTPETPSAVAPSASETPSPETPSAAPSAPQTPQTPSPESPDDN